MKKIFSLILIVVSLNGFAQFPITQSMASANTKLQVNGGLEAKRGIINGVFTDTTAANADQIDFYNGAQIWTRSDRNFWLRDSVLNMWVRIAKFSELGGGSRFGVSGEDDTPAENRLVDFTSTYNLNLLHVRNFGLIADSSLSAMGQAAIAANAFENGVNIGTSYKGAVGTYGKFSGLLRTNWNNGNSYSEVSASPTGVSNNTNYYRAYGDSLVINTITNAGNAPLKIRGLVTGAGSDFLKYDPLTGEVTYDAGGGSGSNFANADLTFTGDRFHELNDFELDITNNNIWSQFFIDGQNRRYSLGDNSAEGNGRAILIRDTATVTPGYMMPAMQQATTSNVLYYNTTTGGITYDAAPGGSVDTVNANAGSVTSNQRFYAKIDSLSSTGWNPNNINHSTRYQHYLDKTSSTYGGFYWTSSGTGSTVTGITTSAVPLGFLYAHSIETGTTTTGLACHYTHQNGTYAALALSSTIRYNFGIRMRLEDLSDGTDTYEYYAGFMDNITGSANIVDGAYFTYTHSASSGQWVCHAENNNTVTSTASGITVAADTNYELEVTVFGGSAYFYIDKVLVATIATNVPDDDVNRITSAGDVIIKSAGTTSRKAFIDWMAFGRQNQ